MKLPFGLETTQSLSARTAVRTMSKTKSTRIFASKIFAADAGQASAEVSPHSSVFDLSRGA